MPDVLTDVAESPASMLTLVKIRDRYLSLMQAYAAAAGEPDAMLLGEIATFQAQVSAAGAGIFGSDERFEAQSTLNYWQTVRINAGERPPTTVLADFDFDAAKRQARGTTPYKGLAPFLSSDNQFFSGRYDLVRSLVDKVKACRLIALVGPSGSGKSSVIRAGLIPSLAEGAYDGIDDEGLTDSSKWSFPEPLKPGPDPLAALEAAHGPIKVPQDLPAALDRHGDTVLLSIDQFEEVFTLSPDDARRTLFLDALVAAATGGRFRHVVVITIRSDFEGRFIPYPALEALFKAGTKRLETMTPLDLRKAIEDPAKRLGVGFDEGLVDKLLAKLQGEPAGLPLLSFTLLKLWEMRNGGAMKIADYEALGGDPSKILANSADKVFENLLPQDQDVVRYIFEQLVQMGERLDATSRRTTRASLAYERGDDIDRVLDILSAGGLIRTSPAPPADASDLAGRVAGWWITPETQIEVAHEALIRNWGKLTGWVKESLAEQTNRRGFALRARSWHEGRGDLLQGLALADAEAKFKQLDAVETEFIKASQRRARRLRRLRLAAITLVALLVAVIIGGLIIVINDQTDREKARIVSDVHTLLGDGDVGGARRLLLPVLGAANSLDDDIRAAFEAIELNTAPSSNLFDQDQVTSVAFASDSKTLVALSSKGVGLVFQPAAGADFARLEKTPIELRLPQGLIKAIAISPDGKRVFGAAHYADSDTVRLAIWTVSDGKAVLAGLAVFPPSDNCGRAPTVSSVAFSRDGSYVVVAAEGNSDSTCVMIFESATGAFVRAMEEQNLATYDAVYSKDDRSILASHSMGMLTNFSADTGIGESFGQSTFSKLTRVRYAPTGDRVATASDTLVIIYSNSEKQYQISTGPGLKGIAYSPDSSLLVTGSDKGRARLWSLGLKSARLVGTLVDDSDAPIRDVAFSPDGGTIALATSKGVTLVGVGAGHRLVETVAPPIGTGNKQESDFWSPLGISSDSRTIYLTKWSDTQSKAYLWVWRNPTNRGSRPENTGVGADEIKVGRDGIAAISYGVDAAQVALLTTDGRVLTQPVAVVSGFAFAISDDGRTFVSHTETGLAILRAGDSRATEIPYPPGTTFSPDYPVALSSAGPLRIAVAASDGLSVLVLDGTGKLLKSVRSKRVITSLVFGPKAATLFVGMESGGGTIIDLDAGSQPKNLKNRELGTAIVEARLSDDGATLLTASEDGKAQLWNTETGDRLQLLEGHQGWIISLQFSPDERRILASSEDGTARLWDRASGRLLMTMRNPSGSWITFAQFSADGREVTTVADDGSLGRWNLQVPGYEPRKFAELACGKAAPPGLEERDFAKACAGIWSNKDSAKGK